MVLKVFRKFWCRVAPDIKLAGYPANFLPDIWYPARHPAELSGLPNIRFWPDIQRDIWPKNNLSYKIKFFLQSIFKKKEILLSFSRTCMIIFIWMDYVWSFLLPSQTAWEGVGWEQINGEEDNPGRLPFLGHSASSQQAGLKQQLWKQRQRSRWEKKYSIESRLGLGQSAISLTPP